MSASLAPGTRTLQWGVRTYIMGIVNVTPDSFSGDGTTDADRAVSLAFCQLECGADIIDIGGESTRPGHTPVGERTELNRVIPVVAKLRSKTNALISIDTTKPEVCRRAGLLGADILNCVGPPIPEILETVHDQKMAIVIMHHDRIPDRCGDVVGVVSRYLENCAAKASASGIPESHIIVDPGIGFGKSPEQNVIILAQLSRLRALGFPVLVGTSRKSTIGILTGQPVEMRAFGTAATVALAIAQRADIVRVHDVAAMSDVAKVSDAISRGWCK